MDITATNQSVYISDHRDDGLRATASADNVGAYWWIGRVLVEPTDRRVEGHGGRLLEALVAAIAKQGGTVIHVAPGGYGADPAQQRAFYEAHGFAVSDESPHLLIRRV